MKKITFFLSLLLTVVGITTTQAQTLLEPSDLKDGRVITLKACDETNQRYMKASAAGSEIFDPRETTLVIEKVEKNTQESSEESNEEETFFFYLKKFSDGKYLQKPSGTGVQIVPTEEKTDAAVFHAVKVSTGGNGETLLSGPKFSGEVTENDVIRFVTTVTNGSAVYFNCQGATATPKYMDGKGTWSVFCVYDAAELCCEEYQNSPEVLPNYVGDPICSDEQKEEMEEKHTAYKREFSEDNYQAMLDVTESKGKFDPNRYYLIENTQTPTTYMETTDDKKLALNSSISGSVSQIWHFEPAGTDSETNKDKYYITTQGVYCKTPTTSNQVELLSKEELLEGENNSFYIVKDENSPGLYALDSNKAVLTDATTNKGGGLSKGNNNQVIGWGTFAGNSKWKLKYVDVYDLVVSSAGWASLNLPFAVELSDGLTAYYAAGTTTKDGKEAIWLKDAGKQIPANFPVVIEGAAKTYSLTILPTDTESTSPASNENQFQGTLLPATPDFPESVYALKSLDNGVAFCKLSATNQQIAANKAYYEAPANVDTNGVSALRFAFDTATGIAGASASAPAENSVWFDLKGRRVLYPSTGIYVNGKGEKVLFQ